MTKIKLVNGTVINAESIDLTNGILRITTKELTVEELATLFSDKSNTSLITLMTEGGAETGYKAGFTSFAGINYVDGAKTVELFQPKDVTEARLANVEATTNSVASSVTDVELAMVELYEMIAGGM